MGLYKLEGDQFVGIEKTSFENEKILERKHIQAALKHSIDIISPHLLVIAEEFSEWDESSRRIDLLAVDRSGDIVVIELKRTEKGEQMDLQSLRYAAMVSTLTLAKAVDIYEKYVSENDLDVNAQEALYEHLYNASDDDFANDVKIILVSKDFGKELTTCVMWLNERNLDITCIRMVPYKKEGELLVDFQQIIPLPEAETYQIQIRKQKAERRAAQKESHARRSRAKYTFNVDGADYNGLREFVELGVWRDYLRNNPDITKYQLYADFSKRWFKPKSAIDAEYRRSKIKRGFTDSESVCLIEGVETVITNQWTITSVQEFAECAKKLGYTITIREVEADKID